MQHLSESVDIDKRITSLIRFHLYFTVSRLLRRALAGVESPKVLSAKYNGSALYGKTRFIHRTNYYKKHRLSDGTLGESIVYQLGDVSSDYKRYVPRTSNGLTKEVGSRMLNDSIAGYVYAVLGAQAKIRASIFNQGAISLQCQDVFRRIVHGSIVSNDVVVSVSNMRKAVSDCNKIVNLAVSADTFLLPSDMTILKKRIPGYSNVLYRASEKNMRFGVNAKVNYTDPKNGGEHLETFHDTTTPTHVPRHLETVNNRAPTTASQLPSGQGNFELVVVGVIGLGAGYSISKYTL